ncbi:MAG: GNAT family N-acetyltransferase [Chloroflexi bacterium]|nr:GNAT family N-acetyltransferase [Chloroflexota bacterium]
MPSAKLSILGGDAAHPLAQQYLQTLPKFSWILSAAPNFASFAQHVHPRKWIELERYAFSAEQLDIAQLHAFKTPVPAEFRIVKIDLTLAKQLNERKNKFADAHGINFDSPEDFMARGFGYCALEGTQIACVGSSFAVSNKGIEIQIDTKKKYQKRGLATAVAANLIIHCLENNLIPGWDAANIVSAQFAEKLGYVPQGSYPIYLFTGSTFLVSLRDNLQKVKRFLN